MHVPFIRCYRVLLGRGHKKETGDLKATAMQFDEVQEFQLPGSGVLRNIFFWGGVSTNSVEDRGQKERGPRGGSPLVKGSGGSCNLVQEISFHTVKFS